MTIDSALRAFILADGAIAAIVGTQMFPDILPQNVLKSPNDTTGAITYTTVSSQRGVHLRGPDGMARPRYQIDCWACTQDLAGALGTLVRRRIEAYTGVWSDGGSPAVTTRVVILFQTEMDMVEPEINGGLGRHSADYFLFYTTAGGAL